jgi:hypothetical protein
MEIEGLAGEHRAELARALEALRQQTSEERDGAVAEAVEEARLAAQAEREAWEATLREEMASLRGRHAAEVTELAEALATRGRELSATQSRCSSLDAELEQARVRLTALEEQLSSTRDALRQTTQRIAALDGELASTRNERQQAAARADSLDQQLAAALAEHAQAAAVAQAEAEERDSRLRRATEEREEIERRNVELQDQVLRAFRKIRGDAQSVEKARKALAIALTLLEPASETTEVAEAGRGATAAEEKA